MAHPWRRALAEILKSAARAPLVIAALPAPEPPPAALADFWWSRPDGGRALAFGSAWWVEASGPSRFAAVRAAVEDLFARAPWAPHPALERDPPAPRVYGGLAFEDHDPPDPWIGFRAACFRLPRWGWILEPGAPPVLQAALTAQDFAEPERCLLELEALLARPAPSAQSAVHAVEDGAERERYQASVRRALSLIERGALSKVVLARRRLYTAGGPISHAAVLGALEAEGQCTRFAMRAGERLFAGATPELLLSVRGRRLESAALAGTSGAGARPEVLAEDKIAREHRLVVDEVRERLAPLVEELVVARRPERVRLEHVAHARTTLGGRLRTGVRALDVAGALHPTPAVGGVPDQDARALIAELEPARGWYAAPVGWVGRDGSAELMVALRSVLIAGDRAWAYAGAGIVRGSDPALELAETELKLRTAESALGLAPAGVA